MSEAPAEGRAAPEVEETPAVTPAPLPRAPRGTIRGRWGTRGRYRPSEARPPILEGQRIGGAERGAAARRTEPGDGTTALVEQLKRYEGVGEKTAETLVEAFGADLLHVLDEEPDRVREVLPDRRADRVLEARRKERDAGGA